MAILVVGDRRHPTQALPESRICFSDVQLSSLFNARIPPINYTSCQSCNHLPWLALPQLRHLATVHASSLALQARSKPMIALIQASSLVATRKIVPTLDFVNLKLAPDVCHRHDPSSG
jgi:hypothetical protein